MGFEGRGRQRHRARGALDTAAGNVGGDGGSAKSRQEAGRDHPDVRRRIRGRPGAWPLDGMNRNSDPGLGLLFGQIDPDFHPPPTEGPTVAAPSRPRQPISPWSLARQIAPSRSIPTERSLVPLGVYAQTNTARTVVCLPPPSHRQHCHGAEPPRRSKAHRRNGLTDHTTAGARDADNATRAGATPVHQAERRWPAARAHNRDRPDQNRSRSRPRVPVIERSLTRRCGADAPRWRGLRHRRTRSSGGLQPDNCAARPGPSGSYGTGTRARLGRSVVAGS